MIDDKLFWKTKKPFLSDKIVGKIKFHSTENDELIKMDLEIAEILNDLFSNIVQTLGIIRYSNNEPSLEISRIQLHIKAILKRRNHPSIAAIRNQCKNRVLVLLKLAKKKLKI